MIRVTSWMAALLALATLASARVYDRCELAHELTSFGVSHDDVATWVCIAYHESRFDTAANNPHSGDHGIFQISELFWCGDGKACGVPCSAFRDENIKDDFKCALRIHEEHTRLQGNGYMAWVVYPQNCQHDTNKYVSDCGRLARNRYRTFDTFSNDIFNNTNIDYNTRRGNNGLPSYLSVSSIFREHYGWLLDLNNKANIDWYNYKVDNIDALKLPVIDKTEIPIIKTTPTTTTTYIPPVMPWRTIETNQFRHKSTGKTSSTSAVKTFDRYTEKSATNPTTTLKPTVLTRNYNLPITVTTTTRRPETVSTLTSTVPKHTNVNSFIFTPFVKTTTYKPFTRSFAPSLSKLETKLSNSSTTPKLVIISTTHKPLHISTTNTPYSATTSLYHYNFSSSIPSSSSTSSPKTTTSYKYIYSSFLPTKTTFYKVFPSTYSSSTFTTTTTPSPPTSGKLSSPVQISSSTLRPLANTFAPYIFSTGKAYLKNKTTPKLEVTTAKSVPKIPTTSQSLLNSYLNPTKQPKLSTHKFPTFDDNKFKFRIFHDGTTRSPTKLQVDQSLRQGSL